MFQNILNNFLEVKRQYIQDFKPTNIISEILPNEFSDFLPIDKQILASFTNLFLSTQFILRKQIFQLIM